MVLLLLLLCFLPGSFQFVIINASMLEVTCPPGYQDGYDGSCYYGPFSSATRNEAYSVCASSNAYLLDVQNAFQNSGVGQRAGSASYIWLGLTCTANTTTSCAWDYGIALTKISYTNFKSPNSPNVNDGACVYLDVKTGFWNSGDCSNKIITYACKYTPNLYVDNCTPTLGYQTATFRGKCYFPLRTSTFATAANTCRNHCGKVASIHSAGNLGASINGNAIYMYTGLRSSGGSSYYWDDGTPVDYKNFDYENTQLGSCVTLAIKQSMVSVGGWISNGCTDALVSVCEKEIDNFCDATTTPSPSETAPVCPPSQYFSQQGTIMSPGYPYESQPNSCGYLITENQGYFAEVTFTDLQLGYSSSISFYSSITAITPFKILNYYNYNSVRTIYSPTNVLRMQYNSTGDYSLWKLQYGPSFGVPTTYVISTPESSTKLDETTTDLPSTTADLPSTTGSLASTTADLSSTSDFLSSTSNPYCDQTYYYSGYIQSPNYYYSYPNTWSTCTNYLNSLSKRVCIIFDYFNLRPNDQIRLYDGRVEFGRLIQTLKANQAVGIYCTNYYSTMSVVFDTNYYSSSNSLYYGYYARWSGSADSLVGTTTDYTATAATAITTTGISSTSPNPIGLTTSEEVSTTFVTEASTSAYDYCGQWYYYSGEIYSDGYYGPYPADTKNCYYYLNAMKTVTCIAFNSFNIRTTDYVILYDGLGTGAEIARNTATGVYCSRNYPTLTVLFQTKYSSNPAAATGFAAKYGADATNVKLVAQ